MKLLWAPWRIRFILENNQVSSECIFCKLPKEKDDQKNLILHQSRHSFVVLNKFPYNSGHLMVVPHMHTASLTSLSNEAFLELHCLIRDSIEILDRTMKPMGYNIGMNLGRAAGAGIAEHFHYHIVPRWNGDTNYMPILADTKVIPESLDETYLRLHPFYSKKIK